LGFTGVISAEEYQQQELGTYRRFDVIGKQGIEKFFETELRGTFGVETVEVDAYGEAERIISKVDPDNGQNITLTIDSELQTIVERAVSEQLNKYQATRASVVVMEPNTGEVLALVSYPAYDANLFIGGIDSKSYEQLIKDPDQPLFPRAQAGEFPSGSVIKPVYAAAALTEGIITPTTSFISVGGFAIGPYYFKDWKAGGHGLTNVYHAIADSVNTFFYIIGGGNETFDGLGLDRLMKYADLFGFGQKTGIDLPGEADGFLPSKQWKEETYDERWYIGDTYNVAIGQGNFIVTPLQIARSTAVFANGGFLIRPKLETTDEVAPQIIQSEVVSVIQDAMRETITNGTAKSLMDLPVEVAGKTGTAQWSSTKAPHSWFTGFAPYNDPNLVVTVLVEEGADDYLSVPIAKDIFNWWFTKYPVDTSE
jgi:penicillin-binding protein 2